MRPSKPSSPFVRDWTRKFHSDDVLNNDRSASLIGCFLVWNFRAQTITNQNRFTNLCKVTSSVRNSSVWNSETSAGNELSWRTASSVWSGFLLARLASYKMGAFSIHIYIHWKELDFSSRLFNSLRAQNRQKLCFFSDTGKSHYQQQVKRNLGVTCFP